MHSGASSLALVRVSMNGWGELVCLTRLTSAPRPAANQHQPPSSENTSSEQKDGGRDAPLPRAGDLPDSGLPNSAVGRDGCHIAIIGAYNTG